MALISRTDVQVNDVITADRYNVDLNVAYSAINGNLDRTNILTRFAAFAICPTVPVLGAASPSVSTEVTVPVIWPFTALSAIGLGVSRTDEVTGQSVVAELQCKVNLTVQWEETLLLGEGVMSTRAVLAAASHGIDPSANTLVFSVRPQLSGTLTQNSVFSFQLYLAGTLVASTEI